MLQKFLSDFCYFVNYQKENDFEHFILIFIEKRLLRNENCYPENVLISLKQQKSLRPNKKYLLRLHLVFVKIKCNL